MATIVCKFLKNSGGTCSRTPTEPFFYYQYALKMSLTICQKLVPLH